MASRSRSAGVRRTRVITASLSESLSSTTWDPASPWQLGASHTYLIKERSSIIGDPLPVGDSLAGPCVLAYILLRTIDNWDLGSATAPSEKKTYDSERVPGRVP